MTERLDYFAAHAPPVPDWFKRKTKQLDEMLILRSGDYTEGRNWDWDETEEERFFRWRWYYASVMLARSK